VCALADRDRNAGIGTAYQLDRTAGSGNAPRLRSLVDGRHTLAKEMSAPITYHPALSRIAGEQGHALHRRRRSGPLATNRLWWTRSAAGKDIYIEKPMSHTAAEGVEMAAAAMKSGRIVQVGSQLVSSVICPKAKELVRRECSADLMLVGGIARAYNESNRGLGISAAD